jgi:choline-sulfatase
MPGCRILLPLLLCLSLPAAVGAGNSTPPSLILISVDTLRADRLSCYGYRALQTPNIDAISKGGTLFSRASSQVPLTLPSHVSMLTSTHPFSNGIEDNGQPLGAGAVTLATILKSRGYRTAAFVGGFVLDRRFGLHQGFDVYDSPFSLSRKQTTDPGDVKRFGEDVVRSATSWLQENGNLPFFIFLHLYDLHAPYRVPESWRGAVGKNAYDTALAYEDDAIGRFWNFLVRQGLLEKSLIVFTSDHGESLGEHGENTHGYFIYESTLRVPLIIHWPSATKASPPRVDEPASLLDLAPTILQFLRVPIPSTFQGRSLPGLVSQKMPSSPSEIYSESLYARNHFGCSSLRSLRWGEYKYIEAPQPEFYNLSQDPGEARNLYVQQSSLAQSYRERLKALRSRYANSGSARPQAPSPDTVSALKSLGYMAGGNSRFLNKDSGPDPKDRIGDSESYSRALALASAGRLAEAQARLQQLSSKLPEISDIRISLGLNQQKLHQHREAIESFRQVLKQDPTNVLAHFNLAVSYFQLKELDLSLKELQAVLSIAPYYSRAEELMGTVWLHKKDHVKARMHFEKLLSQEPTNYSGHYNLGVLATMEERWEEGERHLSAALKAEPRSAEGHNALGSLYLRRGKLEQARQAFGDALRLEPNFAGAHYNVGLVYRRQKKDAQAAEAFRRALAADPQLRPARDALNRLETSSR